MISNFKKLPDNTLINAIGNQVGVGQEILEQVSGYKSNGLSNHRTWYCFKSIYV